MPRSVARNHCWCALFLSAESPGQVLRFLERRRETPPGDLLLSDAVGPQGIRVLAVSDRDGEDTRAWMEAIAPAFLAALGETVTRVFVEDAGWGWRIWQSGTTDVPETFTQTVRPPSFAERIKRLTLGQSPDTASERARTWATGRGLPVDRVPAWARKPLPIVDYDTVAQLDQRSLLVENGPRLYRFRFGTAGGNSTI